MSPAEGLGQHQQAAAAARAPRHGLALPVQDQVRQEQTADQSEVSTGHQQPITAHLYTAVNMSQPSRLEPASCSQPGLGSCAASVREKRLWCEARVIMMGSTAVTVSGK